MCSGIDAQKSEEETRIRLVSETILSMRNLSVRPIFAHFGVGGPASTFGMFKHRGLHVIRNPFTPWENHLLIRSAEVFPKALP